VRIKYLRFSNHKDALMDIMKKINKRELPDQKDLLLGQLIKSFVPPEESTDWTADILVKARVVLI